jgi:predicted CXXCH cytochrome family protein
MQLAHERPAGAARSAALFLGAAALVAVAVFWFGPWRSRPGPDGQAAADVPPDPRLSYAGAFLNVHPSVQYVGDAKCAECHLDLARSYALHPMGHSTVPIREHAGKMPYDREHRNPFDARGVRLWIERDGDRVWHHSAQIEDGQPLWENRQEVFYVVGSGTRGYSYLTEIDGYVFQTAISWFSQKNIWDISPGFHKAPSPGRPIYVGCLQCHANRAKEKPGYLMRYEPGVFDGYNVGCERCHGPGEKHVAFRESGEVLMDPYDKTIVNPARLPWQLRENVCEQCHLGGERRVLRRGRGWFDYRPGTPLEDFLAIYVKNPDLPGVNKAVSHVEQMRKSKCFTKTPEDKKLGCISCHDPHQRVEAKDTVSHYRQRCLTCHQDKGCSVPAAERVKKVADDSCIACHMPRAAVTNIAHTAMTDHTISRRPAETPPGAGDLPMGEWPIVHFHRDRVNARDPERRRDHAVALSRLVSAEMMPPAYRPRATAQSLALLEEVLKQGPTDPDGWHAKAQGLWREQRLEEARVAYLRGLDLDPLNEDLLDQVGRVEQSLGMKDEATAHLKRLVEVNPYETNYLRSLGTQLAQNGDWAGAGEQARAWMKLEPGSSVARQLWVLSLLERGRRDEARREFEKLRKLKPANLAELEVWFRKRGG